MTETSDPSARRPLDADGATAQPAPSARPAATQGANQGSTPRSAGDTFASDRDATSRDAATTDRTGADRSGTDRSAPARTEGSAQERTPRIITTDPSLDEHQRSGVTGATWVALILGTLILILLLIFILQNNVSADFAYFGWEFTLPLGIAMLFAAIAGVLITALLGSVRLFKLSRRVRKLEKERAEIKRAIG